MKMGFWSALIFPIFCLTFLLLGLVINLVQAVLFISIPRTLFRKLNYYLVYGIHGYLLSLGDWWSGNRVNIYCNEDLQERIKKRNVKEHALFLMNHHTELDWLYSWMMGDRLGILGNCRAFAKDPLKFVPIVGWSWALSDMVFLSRGNLDKDQKTIKEKLRNHAEFPSPVWLLMFPEGTRFTAEKHQTSKEFASKSGLPLLEHHLTPRTKGFSFVVKHVDRDKFRAVYDVTLVEGEGSAPFDVTSLINGKACIGNVYVRRISLDDIPKDQEESAAWLHNFYKEKDELKHNYLTTGNFTKDCTSVEPPRSLVSLVLLVVSNLMVHIPILYSVVTGGWVVKGVVLLLGVTSMVAMKVIGDSTKIAKSSKYGVNNNKKMQ